MATAQPRVGSPTLVTTVAAPDLGIADPDIAVSGEVTDAISAAAVTILESSRSSWPVDTGVSKRNFVADAPAPGLVDLYNRAKAASGNYPYPVLYGDDAVRTLETAAGGLWAATALNLLPDDVTAPVSSDETPLVPLPVSASTQRAVAERLSRPTTTSALRTILGVPATPGTVAANETLAAREVFAAFADLTVLLG